LQDKNFEATKKGPPMYRGTLFILLY